MPVLKSESANAATKDAIVLDMGDLRRQADQLRQAAQIQAQRIVEAAEQQATTIAEQARSEAFEQGHREGYEKGEIEGREQGHAEALAENQQKLQQFQNVWLENFKAWNAQRQVMEVDAKQAIMRIGLLFGEKIVHRVIDIDETVVVHQLAEALSYALKPTNVTVHINPSDRPMIDDAVPELLPNLGNLERVRITDDASVSPGGCIIDVGKGRIDATIETQLDRLVETMLPKASIQTAPSVPTAKAEDGIGDAGDDRSAPKSA